MSGSALDPQLRTVGDLFDEDAIYTIPIYQRNYAWRAEQIEQLISDIHDAIIDGDDTYFLGNLIVTEHESPTTDYEVIDGQQRITTLHLLLTFLAEDGDGRYDAHRDRLRYQARPRATEALRRVETYRHGVAIPEAATDQDTGIHEGFNIIQQFIKQHPDLSQKSGRDRFADFLRAKVTLVRASLPPATDLNRYFEIMNTRGEQLQQVDIVKARLMSHLLTEAEQACFAWIWNACADMDSYVQMSLTPRDTGQRSEIFGDNWSWLKEARFERLVELLPDWIGPPTAAGSPTSLEDALTMYAAKGTSSSDGDPENVRFRSTIEYPAFLLHVLKVVNDDDEEREGHLDDKRLIRQFVDAVEAAADKSQWVRDFAVVLLECRNLFDGFVLKRQYTATNGDDGDWSLQRLLRRTAKDGKPRPGYINTFSRSTVEVEEDGNVDDTSSDVLLLQSMLRVTYTSPRTMHWITKVLKLLVDRGPDEVSGSEIADLLRRHAGEKVKPFLEDDQPEGFGISRIVFTYLDYLLLADQHLPDFKFAFRNSIEHFYPQYPSEEQSGEVVSPSHLNLLGNLALVSVSANSKFSNSLPRAKAENYRSTIETQSPKLRAMADITRAEGWGDEQVAQHHETMLKVLTDAVMGSEPST